MNEWSESAPIGDLLVRAAAHHHDRDALVLPDVRRTYGELLVGARTTARGLYALGVRPGDHVGILMPNCLEFVEAAFGVAMLGAVMVPINARFKVTELHYVIENADLVTVLTTDLVAEFLDFTDRLVRTIPSLAETRDAARLDIPNLPRLRNVVLLRGDDKPGFIGRKTFDELAETVPAEAVERARYRVRLRDVAMILYTSGTTSRPKGCMLSHEAIVRTGIARIDERLDRDEYDRIWCPCPLFHVGSIVPLVGAVARGDTFLTMTRFEAGEALALIERERVTTLWPLFPPFTQGLLDHPSFGDTDLSSVRQFPTVGSPDALGRAQRGFAGARVFNAFGMTETSAIITLPERDDDLEHRISTCGRPFRGIEVRIVDLETRRPLPAGEPGEIQVRGYCVFDGYYKSPELTAAALDADGWFSTGDLGALDDGGRVVFKGRLKDMLKVGGENVAAIEVEAFIQTHPAIRHVEVVGLPDPRLDEVPVAFVELRDGTRVSEVELIDFCKQRIAGYKVPRHVHFVAQADWPMSATKVNKAELRKMLHAG